VTSIVFTARDGQRMKLDAGAVVALNAFRQSAPGALEAGGVLLGRWIIERNDVVVDHLTTPMRGDRRFRFAFYRDQRAHQRRIDEAYASSGGTCGYLGEWHTHPEPTPTPSDTDIEDWRRRLRRDQVDVPFVFFAIVGTAEICVWRGARAKAQLEKMEVSDVFDQDPTADDRGSLDEVRGAL
jgi:integrative and conjugative element protein (TIGR02256 family)